MTDGSSPTCVYRASSVGEAQLVRLALEEEGIDANIVGETLPYAGIGAVPIEIYVHQDDVDRARAVIESHRQSLSDD